MKMLKLNFYFALSKLTVGKIRKKFKEKYFKTLNILISTQRTAPTPVVKSKVPSTVTIADDVKVAQARHLSKTTIGKGTYIAQNAHISMTDIGKYCSIGPNLFCGWGIHPTNGLSTHPCFYSTIKQNGMTFSSVDKIAERKRITIGNDVFIGANVTILDGVRIADGAIIAAGAVVVKDIPPYAVAGGVPAKVIKYRFPDEVIVKLLDIKWWDWSNDELKNVEEMFYSVDEFVEKYHNL